MAAPPSALPIEVRRRLWETSWQRLLRPLPADPEADAPTDSQPAPQPTDDERERDAA
jgi:hypothetical protein